MNFANRLKQLRNELDLTQPQLAAKLGISDGAVGNYESGTRTPRLEDLESIADFFNVEIDYLIGRSNNRPEFSLEEQWIIMCYRRSDIDTQTAIKTLLRKFDARDMSLSVG